MDPASDKSAAAAAQPTDDNADHAVPAAIPTSDNTTAAAADAPPVTGSNGAAPVRTSNGSAGSRTRGPSLDVDTKRPEDFKGEVQTTNELPSAELLKKTENYIVLDKNGKTHTFKSLYTGPNVPRRVLVVFVRHFFCGVSSRRNNDRPS